MERQAVTQEIEKLLRANYPKQLNWFVGRPGLVTVLWLGFTLLSHLLVSILFGGLKGTLDVIDYLEDPVYIPVLAIFAAGVYYYFKLPTFLGQTFAKLETRQLFPHGIEIDSDTKMRLSSKRLLWVAPIGTAIIFVVWSVLILLDTEGLKFWFELHIISWAIVTLTYSIGWYVVIGTLLNVLIAIHLANKIFQKNEIQVFPLHPDGSGGFSPLSKFSLWLSYFALVYALFLVTAAVRSIRAGVISSDVGLLPQVFAYFVIVPALFYWSLLSTHKAMLAFRDKLILETSQQYLQRSQRLSTCLPKNTDDLDNELKYIEGLQKLQKQFLSYPVWPFNIRVRLAVLANALVPVIPTLIGVFLDISG